MPGRIEGRGDFRQNSIDLLRLNRDDDDVRALDGNPVIRFDLKTLPLQVLQQVQPPAGQHDSSRVESLRRSQPARDRRADVPHPDQADLFVHE